MINPDEKIKLDAILDKIEDEKKRQQIKEEFLKLEHLRLQQPDSLFLKAEEDKQKYEKDVSEFEKQIKIVQGEVKVEEDMEVKSGLLLLREQFDLEKDIVAREKLNTEILEQERIQKDFEKSLKQSQENLKKANLDIEAAKALQEKLKTQKHALQNALSGLGFKDPNLHKIDNIDCSSLTLSMSSPPVLPQKDKEKSEPPNFKSLPDKKAKDELKKAKVGYLDMPEPLSENLGKMGFNALQLDSPPPPSLTVAAKDKTFKIENHKVTGAFNHKDKEATLNFVKVFEECERNRFIAMGNDPDKFDLSKIKPRVTGDKETVAAILKVCEDRGIGTSYTAKNKPPPPTMVRDDDPEPPKSPFSPRK